MTLLRQVTLDRANRKKDKSVSLTFITQTEQDSNEFMEIDKELNQSGIIYFKPSGTLTQEEVDAIGKVKVGITGKSRSQRLRQALYREWEQSGVDYSSEKYYGIEMEKRIQEIINGLD